MNPPSPNPNKRLFVIVGVVSVLFLAAVITLSLSRHSVAPTANSHSEVGSPLNGAVPIQTPHYKIDVSYSTTTKQFSYQITLYAIINRPDQYDSYVAQLKQYKQEALAYITTHGGNPSKMNITYLPALAANL